MRKDVLFICQFFYPEYVSSALLPFQTAMGLNKSGVTVDILCGFPKEYINERDKVAKKEVYNGINIYRKKYIQLGRKNFLSRLVNYFSFTFVMMMNLYKCKNYKIIIVYSNPPILPIVSIFAKILFKCKIVFIAYDLYPEIAEKTNILKKNSLISKIMKFINRQLFKRVDKVVALSNEMKKFIVSKRNISEDKIEVIENWATEEEDFGDDLSNEFKQLRDKFDLIISYFGNMGTAQDMNTILDTIVNENLPKDRIAFLFAGHGNKRELIRNVIEENGLTNCYLFEYLRENDFNDALKITDYFIVSLENDLLGLAVPSKTYSYYQAAKPVIAIMNKDSDIYKEVFENSAGLAVENGQAKEIIAHILTIINDPNKLKILKSNMGKIIKPKYSRSNQIKKYNKMISNILED